jgi:ATP-dependent RNA helicase RhlE
VLHADRTQAQRRQALEGFRDGRYRCLVATDIAARGLDVEDVGHVINFDVPHAPEDYVHRIGRTARAGAEGRASTFVTSQDGLMVTRMERIIGGKIPRIPVPRDSPVFQAEQERFLAAQRHPGPPQTAPARPEGQPAGRHARTHKKPRG